MTNEQTKAVSGGEMGTLEMVHGVNQSENAIIKGISDIRPKKACLGIRAVVSRSGNSKNPDMAVSIPS